MPKSDYAQKRKAAKLNLSSIVYAGNVILGTSLIPDPQYLLGLDPSHWSNILDWQKAKAAGISFAIIKCMNGVNESQFFRENYKGAKDAGVTVSLYSWLYPQSVVSPGRQAREFAVRIKDHPVDFAPAIDFEWTSPKNPDSGDLYGAAIPLMETLNIHKLICYTAVGYWSQFGSTKSVFADLFYNWQAQYRVTKPNKMPPWSDWNLWQWTDQGDGAQYGFRPDGEKRCTLNYYKGTIEQLRML